MFSYRITGIKKFIYIIVFIIIMGSVLNFGVDYYKNHRFSDPDVYYEKMRAVSKIPCQLTMSSIFEFDFDRAYIAGNEVYADEDYFLEKLNVKTDINIRELFSGQKNRILFIKDDTVIYDYIYELNCTQFSFIEQDGMWVYPETIVALSQQKADYSEEMVICVDLCCD